MIHLEFDAGSLLLSGAPTELAPALPLLTPDPRVNAQRACACRYAAVLALLERAGVAWTDGVPGYRARPWPLRSPLQLRPYQEEAVAAWEYAGRRGVVVLPTGVGKSIVGVQAIAVAAVPALVVLPTIDLMIQWASLLERHFGGPVGMLGGGSKDVRDLTVSTYDSASLMMEFLGNRFGLVIFDECHHLPGPMNRVAAEMCAAPYRLGLTATPERDDGAEERVYDLIGPLVCRREIDEFEQATLSPYDTQRLEVQLDPDDQAEYERHRQTYKAFLAQQQINIASPQGWQQFLRHCATAADGPAAMAAYQTQKRIAGGGRRKRQTVWTLLKRHAGDRVIIFTALNDLAYAIGEEFLLPVITHQTKAAERKVFLDAFRAGSYGAIVTSRVLNEGIDVPEASVGIVVSGSGSVREHVQRLGRLLRPRQGKRAILYELVSAGTAELYVSRRRRQHRAYQGPA